MSSNEKYRIVQKLVKNKLRMEYWPQFKRFGCWWSYRHWSLRYLTKTNIFDTLEEACKFIENCKKIDKYNEKQKRLHNTVVECPTEEKTFIELDKH
jgi:hypothetical protein